ncbi:MAG: type II secretion system protein [Clostridiaceae bacterium]|nr:type II secretion system protein [Clostridiaceae bacterium]
MKGFKKNKKGFTLTELVIVVAILGVLAAIVVPIYSASLKEAREAADNANERALRSAAALYVAENGWPSEGTLKEWTSSNATEWQTYLTDWPERQQDESEWKVTIDGSAKKIDVTVVQAGGSGD